MKKFLIILLTILSVVSCGLIGWYAWVLIDAPEKIVSQTFKIGEQRVFKDDGSTEKQAFIDVNLYDNVFEIKFNYMLDETQTAFYSQGLQYVLKDGISTFDLNGVYNSVAIELENKQFSENYSFAVDKVTTEYFRFLDGKVYSNVDKFNYMSGDNYETTLISTNPINDETMFKIQLGNDLYGMCFRDINIDFDKAEDFYLGSETFFVGSKPSDNVLGSVGLAYDLHYRLNQNYAACDIDFFVNEIYESCKSLNPGTSQTCIFEFGNLFNYYLYDADSKQYTDKVVDPSKLAKISEDVKSYYCINVNIHDGNMTSSSQSLFNCYKGNSNFNLEDSFEDYFYGRTLVSVDVNKFDFIETETTGSYYLSLNSQFRDFYAQYKHLVEFDIQIDLDYLDSLGINFLGVIQDSLEDYKIYNSETIRVVDGEIVKGVVNYV